MVKYDASHSSSFLRKYAALITKTTSTINVIEIYILYFPIQNANLHPWVWRSHLGQPALQFYYLSWRLGENP